MSRVVVLADGSSFEDQGEEGWAAAACTEGSATSVSAVTAKREYRDCAPAEALALLLGMRVAFQARTNTVIIDRGSVLSNLCFEIDGTGKRAKARAYRTVLQSLLADFVAAARTCDNPCLQILCRTRAVDKGLVGEHVLNRYWAPHRLCQEARQKMRQTGASSIGTALDDVLGTPPFIEEFLGRIKIADSSTEHLVIVVSPDVLRLDMLTSRLNQAEKKRSQHVETVARLRKELDEATIEQEATDKLISQLRCEIRDLAARQGPTPLVPGGTGDPGLLARIAALREEPQRQAAMVQTLSSLDGAKVEQMGPQPRPPPMHRLLYDFNGAEHGNEYLTAKAGSLLMPLGAPEHGWQQGRLTVNRVACAVVGWYPSAWVEMVL